MKKLVFVLSGLFSTFNFLFAQNDFFKGIDLDSSDFFYTFDKTVEGGIIAAGESGHFSGADLFIVKTDSNLNMQWLNYYKDTTNSISEISPRKILSTADSGFFLCGTSYQPIYNGAVIKFNSSGIIQWYKRYLTPGIPYSYAQLVSMISVNDTEFVLLGTAETTCPTAPKKHIFICKIDQNGSIIWSKFYVQPNLCYDELPYDIIKTIDAGFLITGENKNYGNDAFAMKIDSSGNLQWYKIYQSGSYLYYKRILKVANGSFILAGHTYTGTAQYCCLTKINSNGNIMWNKLYDSTYFVNDCEMRSDSTILFTSFGSNPLMSIGVKTDLNGNVISSYIFSDSSIFQPVDLNYMNDSSILLIGSYKNTVTNSRDGFLIKADSLHSTCFTIPFLNITGVPFSTTFLNINNYFISSAVQDTLITLQIIQDTVNFTYYDLCNLTQFNEILNSKSCLSVFPNPVTDKLTITSKTNEPLEITLFDLTSRKLLQQQFTNSTSINTSNLSKGIYIYELRNKNGVIKKGKVIKD
jgi:hypothetical protein